MIKVLHVTSGMDRGGIETFIMNIYRKIDRSKVQFDFLLSSEKEDDYNSEIRNLGGEIFHITPRGRSIISNRKALDEFFRLNKGYKVVHQHVSSLSYVEPLKFARKYSVPIRIVHSHNTKQNGSSIHNYVHKYNQFFIKSFATHYFACSGLAAKWLYPKKLFKSNKYEIINNAIDTERFLFNKTIRNIKKKELSIEGKFVLGHVGRFSHQKNHKFLIEIFKEVHDKDKDSVLLLVGDGTERFEIKNRVMQLGLSKNVIFMGVRSDIPELLQAMDVFVMPSFHEVLPVTLVVGQASGLPCVSSTNITSEVQVLESVKWCNLSDHPSNWASKILYFKDNYIRGSKKKEIINAGYDVVNVARYLQNLYLEG